MISEQWPHYNKPDGWKLAPGDSVYSNSPGKHNLTQFAKESRAFIAERNAELDSYLSLLSDISRHQQRQLSGPKTQIESPPALAATGSRTITKMRKKIRFKRGRRRRPISASLRSRQVPFRMVLPIETTNGLLTHTIKMKTVAIEYLKTFDEFRCSGFAVRFVPSAITSEGVYTTVLLDGPGFPAMTGTASVWFTRLGDMPGSVLRHCAAGFTHRWKPTSPPAKTWVRLSSGNYDLATLYISTSNDQTSVKGAIHITGSVRVRGEYNSAVSTILRCASIPSLDALAMDEHSADDM